MSTSGFASSPGERPRLGVVVVWPEDAAGLYDWLADLTRLDRCRDLDVVLVAPAALVHDLNVAALPRLRCVDATPGQSPAALRSAGMAAADADIILFTDRTEHDFIRRLDRLRQDVGLDLVPPHVHAPERPAPPVPNAAVARSTARPPFDL